MSSEAWAAYDVPGSPYFVLVDGPHRPGPGRGHRHRLAPGAGLLDPGHRRRRLRQPARGPAGRQARRRRRTASGGSTTSCMPPGIAPGDPSLYGAPDDPSGEHDHGTTTATRRAREAFGARHHDRAAGGVGGAHHPAPAPGPRSAASPGATTAPSRAGATGSPSEVPDPVVHLANFALPEDRGDFGSGAVDLMGAGPRARGPVRVRRPTASAQPLFAAPAASPRSPAAMFSRRPSSRRPAARPACQLFFTQNGRAFCLYVVLGDQREAAAARPDGQRRPGRHDRRPDDARPAPEDLPDEPARPRPPSRAPAVAACTATRAIAGPTLDGTFAERVVHRAVGAVRRATAGARFLARTAVVGLRPGGQPARLRPQAGHRLRRGVRHLLATAGPRSAARSTAAATRCPPDSFVAGWWKADNAAYCCGAARYIIDCNATCPTQCACRCSGASLRRAPRLLQPVPLRPVPPGDLLLRAGRLPGRHLHAAVAATTRRARPTALTDNRTATHGASCLAQRVRHRHRPEVPGPRRRRRASSAPSTQSERATPDGGAATPSTRTAASTGARRPARTRSTARSRTCGPRPARTSGAYGFPTSDVISSSDGRDPLLAVPEGRDLPAVDGTLRRAGARTTGVPPATAARPQQRPRPPHLPDPHASTTAAPSTSTSSGAASTAGAASPSRSTARSSTKHEALRASPAPSATPRPTSAPCRTAGAGPPIFEHGGVIYYTTATGAQGVWGPLLDAYVRYGGYTSDALYPTTTAADVGDGRGRTFQTQTAQVWWTSTTGGRVVPGACSSSTATGAGPVGRWATRTATSSVCRAGRCGSRSRAARSPTPPDLDSGRARATDQPRPGPPRRERVTGIEPA